MSERCRIEVGAAEVRRSVATVREAIRRGEVSAVRDERMVLVDMASLRQRFAPQPIEPTRGSKSKAS